MSGPAGEDTEIRNSSALTALEVSFDWYVRNARSARNRYHVSEVALLFASASIPVSAAITPTRWIPGVLGGVVVVLAGLRPIFGWHEDWLRFTDACQQLKRERLAYQERSGPYEHDDRDTVLVARTAEVEVAETHRWIALRRGLTLTAGGGSGSPGDPTNDTPKGATQ